MLRTTLAALLLLSTFVTGCLPSRVTIDLAPQPSRLAQTEVIRDKGVGVSSPRVALIELTGLISHTPDAGLFDARASTADALVARLEKAEKDDSVRAVVLRVNSPGGTVAASDTLYNEITRFREKTGKPVVVSMADVAASGGYYIALAADRIIAQKSTVTGSIGVIFQTLNFSKGMAMIGIEGRAVVSAPNKDLANPFAPVRDSQYAVLQRTVDNLYADFRSLVKARRPALAAATPQRFDELTDGRVMTAADALDAGLIDALGGVREAYESAKSLAGITSARLVKYHAPGDRPLSPYAAEAPAPPSALAPARVDVSLLNLPAVEAQSSGRFMYLWSPTLP